MTEPVKKQENRPKVAYRVELEKRLEINKSYSERKNQAIAIRILSFGLFGKKRYQNLYLTCSLNCFYWALKIANFLHRRVPELAMIIKFQNIQVLEHYQEQFEGKNFQEKKYSKIIIKLTTKPTEEDKNQAGFNVGLSEKEIEDPLKDVIIRKRREGQSKPRRKNQRKDQRRREPRREDRRERDRYYERDDRYDNRRPQPKNKPTYRKYRDDDLDYREQPSRRYDNDYQRGEKRTRGNNSKHTASRPQRQYERDTDYKREPKREENRGHRNPKKSRYSSEDD